MYRPSGPMQTSRARISTSNETKDAADIRSAPGTRGPPPGARAGRRPARVRRSCRRPARRRARSRADLLELVAACQIRGLTAGRVRPDDAVTQPHVPDAEREERDDDDDEHEIGHEWSFPQHDG